MPSVSQLDDYVIQYGVDTAQIKASLDKYIEFLESLEKVPQKRGALTRTAGRRTASGRKSRSKSSQTAATALQRYLRKDYIPKIRKMQQNLSASPGSFLGKKMRESAEQVQSNVLVRLKTNFVSARRLTGALGDPQSAKTLYSADSISVGVGSKTLLDEWTSIYIDRFGDAYTPPASYSVHSWWSWQAFTGVGEKTNFESPGTYWWVTMLSHPPYSSYKGGFEPRPFLLLGQQLIDEDQQIVDKIPDMVRDAILNSIDKK